MDLSDTSRDDSESSAKPMRGDATRQRIKLAARRLFAQRGLDSVSIRDIVRAAGQKNAGSINYYFKSKDDLLKELVFDVAKMLDDHHNQSLDVLEAEGGPRSIRDVVSILITYPTMEKGNVTKDEYALRFLNAVLINHRDLMFAALKGGVDRGTRRCMEHLRRLAGDVPPVLLNQRLTLVITYLFAAASSREASLANSRSRSSLWEHPAARDNLIDTVEGMLLHPASGETLRALG